MHALIWTLLNTELLNRSTKDELQKICVLIDQFIATWISDEDATTEECAKKVSLLLDVLSNTYHVI